MPLIKLLLQFHKNGNFRLKSLILVYVSGMYGPNYQKYKLMGITVSVLTAIVIRLRIILFALFCFLIGFIQEFLVLAILFSSNCWDDCAKLC